VYPHTVRLDEPVLDPGQLWQGRRHATTLWRRF
jgi:hypothetical protein